MFTHFFNPVVQIPGTIIVTHSWGGAAKTYEYAKKKDLQLINLAEKELL